MTDKTATTALAVRSIEGTLPERIAAFKSIAEAMCAAQVAPAGWERPNDFMAGCWMADAVGQHPITFMMNNHVMLIDGKRFVEPKWEYITGMLSARLPGFKWGTNEETDKAAEVWMEASGRGRHVVRYTVEDAERQGLLGKWQKRGGNIREMLFKQTVKRCGRRIGPDVLMGLPAGLGDDQPDEMPDIKPTEPTPSVAEVVDEAVVEAQVIDYRAALAARLDTMYGKLHHKTKLMKLTYLANEMRREKKMEPVEYDRAGNVPQSDAREILEWLDTRKEGTAPPPAVPFEDRHAGEDEGAGMEPAPDDVPPADEDVPPPYDSGEADGEVETLFHVAAQASKVPSLAYRTWIKESPTGSKVFWFTDMGIRVMLNIKDAIKLKKDGVQTAPPAVVEMLVKALRHEIDKAEDHD